MRIKRISVRFNLDCDNDRMAWEALHRIEVQSINREIIERINAKEQTNALRELIRQVVSEELARAEAGRAVRPAAQAEVSAEEINSVFDFLDSF